MNQLSRCLVLSLCCILSLGSAYSQFETTYLGIEKGLSNNSVRCIYQDRSGFLWFGTFDGLNRYDGYSFKIFRNIPGHENSLPHNYINAIGEDRHDNVLIGTGQGLSIYNKLTGEISQGRYLAPISRSVRQLKSYINDIQTDSSGNVYIATNGGGLYIKHAGRDTAEQVVLQTSHGRQFDGNVQAIVIAADMGVWAAIADAGLYRIDHGSGELKLVNTEVRSVRCMAADGQGNVWISAYDGLYRFDPRTLAMKKVHLDLPAKRFSENILSLKFTGGDEMWMGTEGMGIAILSISTGLVKPLPDDLLSSSIVYMIYQDRDHRKWIGTYKGGVNIIQPAGKGFHTISRDGTQRSGLSSNFVNCLHETSDGRLWIGTDGGGTSIWDRHTNAWYTIKNETCPASASITSNSISSIAEDAKGIIWIASYGGGIDRVDNSNGTRKHYKCFNDLTGRENPYVWRLFRDSYSTLWAATYVGGLLYYYDAKRDRFAPFNHDRTDFVCLAEDHDRNLWAGYSEGIVKVNRHDSTYTFIPLPKPVRAIFEDSRHRFWLGTEGHGLILYDRVNAKIMANFTEADGLCNNAVLNILEDKKGILWLSTFNGLSRFDPDAKSCRNYFQEDGLQSNQFEYNAALKLASGQLAFGGIKGLTLFSPDSIRQTSAMPSLTLTELLVDNTPVAPNSPYVAKKNDDMIEELIVPINKAALSFGFTALEYEEPEKIRYAYYLDGWDKSWNLAGKTRTATYTRLQEGSYTMRIKSTNILGEWNPAEKKIRVIILPPWYRTWTAYLIYLAGFLAMVYLFISYRTRQNRLQYEIKLLQLRTEQEKKLVSLERAKEKELNEKKISLFTRISHEFRTPLTLIINPLLDLLSSGQAGTRQKDIQSIYRNARRLLSLTDQLLLFQKANTGEDPLILSCFSYSQLCREVYLYFEHDAQLKKIGYRFECADDLDIYGDRQKLEMVLINLLSNAFKYTPPGGSIVFRIEEFGNKLVTTISDTGAGIPASEQEKIFQRFYQSSVQHTVVKPGFGIGLFLAKSFIDLHKGAIGYTSEQGKGTSFTIELLKGCSHAGANGSAIVKDTPLATDPQPHSPFARPIENDPEHEETHEEETLITSDVTILLIEDDLELRTYMADMFQPAYRVIQAASAESGLVMARENLPDLIITDITMLEMTGIELCRILKTDPAVSHIPIIMLTATTTPTTKLQAIEFGADDYFNKPFDKDLLIARVANLLKNRTTLQNYFFNEVTLQRNEIKISEEYKTFLEKCIAIVEENIEDGGFSVHSLATAIGMSHSKLYKKVKSISGLTINAFIRYIRLRKAAELFIHSDMNINQTAFSVGFNNVKYFQKQFFKLFGLNPSEYIKKYRKPFSKGYRLNKDALGKK